MSNRADDRQQIIADLHSWVKQNQGMSTGWYLDEGDQPGVIPTAPVAEKKTAPAKAQAPVTPPPAPPVPNVDKEAAFRLLCDQYVDQALLMIKQEPSVTAEADPLVAAHQGDAGAALAALAAEVSPCTACDLSSGRTTTVFGTGNPTADVVFIGDTPGLDEDRQGEPFVGESGKLLTKILGAIGFARQDVYLANVLKCQSPEGRDPLPEEVRHCEPHLRRQLAIIQPRVICCLGRVAAQALLKTDLSLAELRERVHFYAGVPVMATYHPAALLRNPGWKRDTWEDVRKLRALSDALQKGTG